MNDDELGECSGESELNYLYALGYNCAVVCQLRYDCDVALI